MESAHQNGSHPEYPDVPEFLPGKEDSCLEQEEVEASAKHVKSFIRG
jgi:hypothetical protein